MVNSQLENTPTVAYLLGSTRHLQFNRREIVKGNRGNKWLDDTEWSTSFELKSNSVWINNPGDEHPSPRYQYQHGGVKVGEGELSIGFDFQIGNSVQEFNDINDLRLYDMYFPKYLKCLQNIITPPFGPLICWVSSHLS